jgi:hypothetical protein
MKNLILILAIIFIGIFYSCEKDNEEILIPLAQEVEVTIYYDGVAHTPLCQEYPLAFYIYKDNGRQEWSDFLYICDQYVRGDGYTYTFKHIFEPGYYYTEGFWDWGGNVWNDTYDPQLENLIFKVEGYETQKIEVELIDQVSETDLGWAEGELSYNGTITGTAPIYVEMLTAPDKVFVNRKQIWGEDFSIPRKYTTEKVIAGTYYIFTFWDLNKDGDYDGGEPRRLSGYVDISPGLPTFNINIILE